MTGLGPYGFMLLDYTIIGILSLKSFHGTAS
jgi:hypothetical protein